MRWKDNFYFYFSIALLIFCFVLIFHFYEKNFELSGFVDVKTILGVGGTVFGAYFGAKTAGKYAIGSVEKQLKYQKDLEEKKERRVFERVILEHTAHCEGLHTYFMGFLTRLENLPETSLDSEKISYLEESAKYIEPKIEKLNKIDIAEIYDRTYFKLGLLNIGANILLENIQDMAKFKKAEQEKLFSSQKAILAENIDKFMRNIIDTRKVLDK